MIYAGISLGLKQRRNGEVLWEKQYKSPEKYGYYIGGRPIALYLAKYAAAGGASIWEQQEAGVSPRGAVIRDGNIVTINFVKNDMVTTFYREEWPPRMFVSFSNGLINLSWLAPPMDWYLETQTNPDGIRSSNWFRPPAAVLTNSVTIRFDSAKRSEFFRLVQP